MPPVANGLSSILLNTVCWRLSGCTKALVKRNAQLCSKSILYPCQEIVTTLCRSIASLLSGKCLGGFFPFLSHFRVFFFFLNVFACLCFQGTNSLQKQTPYHVCWYLSISYRIEKCEDFNMEALCVYVCICVCVLLRPNSLSEPEYFCILEKNHWDPVSFLFLF